MDTEKIALLIKHICDKTNHKAVLFQEPYNKIVIYDYYFCFIFPVVFLDDIVVVKGEDNRLHKYLNFKYYDAPHVLTHEDIKNTRIPTIDEVVCDIETCDACAGNNIVSFSFNHNGTIYTTWDDCPVCDGEGKIQTNKQKTGKQVIDKAGLVFIGGGCYEYKKFDLLKTLSEYFPDSDIIHIENRFIVDDIHLVLPSLKTI